MTLQEITLFVDKFVWFLALYRICAKDFSSKSLVPEEDIIEMVKIIAPLVDQVEAVKILASHTNNLRVHQKFKKNFKMNPALNMLKLLIKKRNQPSEDQKNGVE